MGQALNHPSFKASAQELSSVPALHRVLSSARLRLRAKNALSVAIRIAWVVLPILFLEGLAARIWHLPDLSLLRALMLSLPLLGGIIAFVRPPNPSKVAHSADQDLGAESLVLALRSPETAAAGQADRKLQPLLIQRIQELVREHRSPSRAWELLLQLRTIPAPLLLLALATIAIGWAPGRQLRTPPAILPADLRAQAAQLKVQAQRSAESGTLDQTAQDAVKQFASVLKHEDANRSTLENALKELEKSLAASHQDWNAFEAEAQSNPLLSPITNALKAADRKQALAAIKSLTEKIKSGTLKATLVKQTVAGLNQAAANASNPALANRLKQAAESMAAGNGQGSQAALNSLMTLLAPPPPEAQALEKSVVALRARAGKGDRKDVGAQSTARSSSSTPSKTAPPSQKDNEGAFTAAESLTPEQQRILERYFAR